MSSHTSPPDQFFKYNKRKLHQRSAHFTRLMGVVALALFFTFTGLVNALPVSAASIPPKHVEGVGGESNLNCNDIRTGYAQNAGSEVWLEYKIDSPWPTGNYIRGDGTFSVSISNATGQGFDFSANMGVVAVFVKGGAAGHNLYLYHPDEVLQDTNLVIPGNAISHVTFCYKIPPPKLTVSKTAETEWVQDYTWEISKDVDQPELHLFAGQTGTVTYTVAVTPTIQNTYSVAGIITIKNETDKLAKIASIVDEIDDYNDPVELTCTLNGSPFTVPGNLPAGETLLCAYSESISGASNPFGNSNTVTVNVAGDSLVQGGTATKPFTFSATADVVNDGTITVTDTVDEGTPTTLGQEITGVWSVEYPQDLSCSSELSYTDGKAAFDRDNVAKILQTGDQDAETVQVNCYQPSVSKSVQTSYIREFNWTVGKSVEPQELHLFEGASETVTYTVNAIKSAPIDSDFQVTGEIIIANPAPMPAVFTVADVLSNGASATVTCPDGLPVTVPANDAVTCTYEVALSNPVSGTNIVTATLTTDDLNHEYVDSAAVTFGAPATAINNSVDIDDTNPAYAGQGGPAFRSTSFSQPFEYTVVYGCSDEETGGVYAAGKHSRDEENTVTLTSSGNTVDEDGADVEVNCYQPSVSKTAVPGFTREYAWEIAKSVTPDTLNLWEGEDAQVDYTVDVTRTVASENGYNVSGIITVNNPNPVQNLEVIGLEDLLSTGVGNVAITTPACTVFPFTVPAGSSTDCVYNSDVTGDANGTNTATITVTNDLSYSVVENYSFSGVEPGEVNASATVTDTNEAFGGPWVVSGSNSTSYPVNLSCADVPFEDSALSWQDTILNTAHLTASDGIEDSDDADVALNCFRLGVSKDANPSFTREFFWDIDKVAEPTELLLSAGETGTVTYTVSVTQTGSTDSEWLIEGDITIVNPAPMTATVTVTDVLPGFTVELDASCTDILEIGPDDTQTCGYTATPDQPVDVGTFAGTNTATTTLAIQDGTKEYSGQAAVGFGAPTTLIRDTILVDDENERQTRTFGPFAGTDNVEYSEHFTCEDVEYNDENTGSYQFPNTATIRGTEQSADENITVFCARPALEVTKEAHAPSVDAGEPITFTITVSNHGAALATNVLLTDTLPTNGGLSWTLVDDLDGQCAIESGVLSCTFAELGSETPDNTRVIQITSPTSTATCGLVSNQVQVSSDHSGSDEAGASVNVLCNSITIVKETVGGEGTFGFSGALGDFNLTTIIQGSESQTFTNLGPGTYNITENVPQGWGLLDIECVAPQSVSVGTATATVNVSGGQDVTCTFTNAIAEITIEKLPDIQTVVRGSDVEFTIIVTNTGQITLSNVTVTDAVAPNCDNNLGTLAPGADAVYTCTLAEVLDDLTNIAVVTGTPPAGPDVTDNDDADVQVAEISLEKATNGEDADEATGPVVPVGSNVTWTYVVVNTGNVVLTDVTVTDDRLADSDIECPQATLAAGESMTCEATGIAQAGQYANLGTVVGRYGEGEDDIVDDEDPSHYFGAAPAISLEKATNGEDADEPTGPVVTVGSTVTWTYFVRNTGNVELTDVTVTDDRLDDSDIECPQHTLAVGESMTCEATGIAQAGQYANLGTVTGRYGEGADDIVDDEDPSHYFGAAPAYDFTKYVNNEDADTFPAAVTANAGATLTFEYEVVNTGNVAITWTALTDDVFGDLTEECELPRVIAVGDSAACEIERTAGDFPQGKQNIGTASVTGLADQTDPAWYKTPELPAISLEKATNGEDADEPTGPVVTVGSNVIWTYVVVNTGNVVLTDVTVTDDNGTPNDPQDDFTVCNGFDLEPGQSNLDLGIICTINGLAQAGQYKNLGTVVGRYGEGADDIVDDEDPSHYFGAAPAISLEKATNGEDADIPEQAVQLTVGDPVVWTYFVQNTGNVALTNVTITDDQGVNVTCPQTVLDVGAEMTCTGSGTAQAGEYKNIGTVTGTPPAGSDVTDTDPSHYFGNPIPLGTLGDFVWEDEDEDGIQDTEEPGVPGVTVNLYQSGGVDPIAATTTNDDGEYRFENLPAGEYFIEFILPDGYEGFSDPNQGNDPAIDSNADPVTGRTPVIILTPGQVDLTWDAGLILPPIAGTELSHLGDTVWQDLNGNGLQDPGEPGISGQPVELYKLINDTFEKVAETVTNGAGNYLFSSLEAGTYQVQFPTAATIDGFSYTLTLQNVGNDSEIDSEPDSATGRTNDINLPAGITDLTWDAGYACADGGLVTGRLDAGDASGGVQIILQREGADPITVTTSADGTFSTKANPGVYTVSVQDEALLELGLVPADGKSRTVTVEGCKGIEVPPFPYEPKGVEIEPVRIGDYVWLDQNQNGLQDEGEPGVGGVTVKLFRVENNISTLAGETTTDTDGFYLFDDLEPGVYYVEFVLPDGYSFTVPNVGNNDRINSKAVVPALSLALDSNQDEVQTGGTLDYTIDYSNTGDRPATGASASFIVPANTSIDLSANPGWSCDGANAGARCTLQLGTLQPGQPGQEILQLKIDEQVDDAPVTVTLHVELWQTTDGITFQTTLATGDEDLRHDAGLVERKPSTGDDTPISVVNPPTNLPPGQQPGQNSPSIFVPAVNSNS